MTQEFNTPISSMDDHQKEWFATAIVSMILADGNVTREESDSLMRSISFVRNPTLVETLKKYIAFQTVPNLTVFTGWEKNLKNRAIMMLDLMKVAIADRDFSPKEREQFLLIGKILGFPRHKVEELITMGTQAIDSMGAE